MVWNYRVIKQSWDGVDCYGIHEVYYNIPDDDSSIWAITEDTVGIYADVDPHEYDSSEQAEHDACDSLRQSYLMMGQALLKPPIDLDVFQFANRTDEDPGFIPMFENELN